MGTSNVVAGSGEHEKRKGVETVVEKRGDLRDEVIQATTQSPPRVINMAKLEIPNPIPSLQVTLNDPSIQSRSVQSLQTPQNHQQRVTLSSRKYTNRITLLIFIFHMIIMVFALCFFIYKLVQGMISEESVERKREKILKFWLPQVEGSAVVSILVALLLQKAIRMWPHLMVKIVIWSSFTFTLTAGILLLCFSMPSTDGVGVIFIAFSIGNGLYSCWVTSRLDFTSRVLSQSLNPVGKFPDLNQPTYWMLGIGLIWICLWNLAIVGALNFYLSPLTIIAMILSLAWTAEVMRNVTNLTVSRVLALYYLRGMQSNTRFCFHRAVTINLGSACLGSLFLPAIEALRIFARGLNLLEGEDEFMFSCAHCCLRVMETIFRYGNSWAFVHIAAYGRDFVTASQSTWNEFEKKEMVALVDSDITSSICFLSGVSSGSLCVIFAASWTFTQYKHFSATVSLVAFYIGYLLVANGRFSSHA